MADFVAEAAAYQITNAIPWLAGFQREQVEHWRRSELPKRNTEQWKYTRLRAVEKTNIGAEYEPQDITDEVREKIAEMMQVDGLDSHDIVFVNGHFDDSLSASAELVDSGISISVFSHASASQQKLIGDKLGSIACDQNHLFVSLNGSRFSDGVLVHAENNCQLDKTIRVVHVSAGTGKRYSVSPRLFVYAEENAKVKIVEHFLSDDQVEPDFVNSVSEFDLSENATIEHCRLHLEHESAVHIGGVHARLGKSSTFDSFHLALGSQLKRIDLVAHLVGSGAHCEVNGLYLPSNNQHVDYHTCIEHKVPHCTSNEVFRGIVADQAKAVFNGRIHIHKDAQKTLAKLSNKNLLTSRQAEVDTKPELEIYADDVQCAHGATVAQLDDEAMHYLLTRGISPSEAKVMLSFGFVNTLVDTVKFDAVAEHLRLKLRDLFSRDTVLLRSMS